MVIGECDPERGLILALVHVGHKCVFSIKV